MSQEATADRAWRRDIDGLRAVSIALVVCYHAFHRWMPGGLVGVDVFFVISGYLITGIISRRLAAGDFSFAWFYSRRVRRIFPALFLVLAAVLVFGWFELLPPEYRNLGWHTAAGAGFVSNLALLQGTGYFDGAAESNPLQHLWSLGVEEQFYIFWPLLLWIGRRRIRPAAMAGILAVLSFVFCVTLAGHNPDAAFYLPFSRAWELMAGAVLACIPPSPQVTGRRAEYLSVAGCLLIAAAAIFGGQEAFHVWWAVPPVAGAVLVILAGPGASINRVLLSSSPAVLAGAISYPLYLWHWPILAFSNVLAPGGPTRAESFLGVMAALVLAWLTWRYLER
ncbi:MAG TPA: acyltransferase, partial [Bryobacteraceae bacterium]|nr:acyltransferase [Bryobacteraceae bacterium]